MIEIQKIEEIIQEVFVQWSQAWVLWHTSIKGQHRKKILKSPFKEEESQN